MTAAQAAAVAPVDRDELLEVCARHADALAGQIEAAERQVDAQLRQLNRCEVRSAYASGEWVAATLQVVADSLGELHTVLDEAGARGAEIDMEGESW